MVINKLFGKKESANSIDSLKERFAQVSSGANVPGSTPSDNAVPSSNPPIQVHDAIDDASVDAKSRPAPQVPLPQAVPAQAAAPVIPPPPVQNPVPVFGQQPLGVAPGLQPAPQTAVPLPQAVSAVAQPAPIPQAVPAQPVVASQNIPAQPSPSSPAADLPSWAVESTGETIANDLSTTPSGNSQPQNQNKAAETLEAIEDKFYDAKLNSLIIDQVKELIEIDNNLNTKIDELSAETKKEILEREKLAKKVDEHFEKVKELERNMEKFLGLYEMVTNQFNPFVDKGSTDMFLDEKDKQFETPVVKDVPQGFSSLAQEPTPVAQVPVSQAVPAVQSVAQPSPQSAPIPQAVPIQPVPAMSQPVPQQSATPWSYCPIHHNVHPSMHFELKDGQKLSSIYDVLAVLEQMDDELFSHHVSLKHNDFSNWVYKVLGLTDLGQQLDLIKTKPEMIQSIRSYIQSKMPSAN